MRAHPLVALLLTACSTTSDPVASRFFKKVRVHAVDGATFTITAAESPTFAGLTVSLPPSALGTDTDVTVEEGLDPLGVGADQPASAVLWLGPDGTMLAAPARISLPIPTPDPGDQPEDLQVLVERAGGLGRIAVPGVAVDLAARRVGWETSVLGRSQVIRRTCRANGECAPGECVNGRCRGASCGSVRCAPGARCCNPGCEQCGAVGAPCAATTTAACAVCGPSNPCPLPKQCIGGICRDPAPVPCGPALCPPGSVCCDPACGQCVGPGVACPATCPPRRCTSDATTCAASDTCCPPGQTCVNQVCQPAAVTCGTAVCRNGQVCCNASCNTCVNAGEACSQVSCLCPEIECGPLPAGPSCTCADGTLGCNTGRCMRDPSTTTGAVTCHWEFRTCP